MLQSIAASSASTSWRSSSRTSTSRVADASTRKLIDAKKAVWVLGGTKPGVMTKRAKWAFEDRAAADAFVKGNGGIVTGFPEAIRAAYEDMDQDTSMIRAKRKAVPANATGSAAPVPVPAAARNR